MVDLIDTPEDKPEATAVNELANDMFQYHDRRRSDMKQMWDMVNRRFKPFVSGPDPERFRPIIPGTAGAKVHRTAAQIVSDRPIVSYPPRNTTNKAQDEADRLEQWGSAFLQRMNDNSLQPPLETAAKHAMMGMWVLKGPMFNFNAWPDPPTKKGKPKDQLERELHLYRVQQAERFAFEVEAVDPMNVVWDDSNSLNPAWVIERYEMPYSRFRRRWPSSFNNPKNKTTWQNVEVTTYHSDDWRMILGDGEVVSYTEETTGDTVKGAIENVYGYPPFQFGFGPWSWLGGKPEDMSRGMLFFIEDEIFEEARIKSIKSWQAQLYGMTPLVSKDPEKTMRELAAGIGAVLSSDDPDVGKGAPRPMELPEPPSWLDRYEGELKSTMSENTFSPALEGFREEGMTSGTMSGLHIGEARQLFRPVTTRMSAHVGKILNRAAGIIENLIDEPVSVWADTPTGREMITIDPDIWKGAYHFSVDLEPVDPTRDDRRGMLGLNYFNSGLLDPWTTLEEFLKIPNADDVIQRIMKWEVMRSPEMMQAYAKIASEEIGLADILADLEQGAEGESTNPNGDGTGGTFAPMDGSELPQEGIRPGTSELQTPATGPGRLGANVPEPTNGALDGFRT